MNRKLTATLLILAAVLANVGFSALGSIFDYPDVLNEPAGKVLAAFRDSQGAVRGWFLVLAISAGLLAPVAIGVGRLSAKKAMRIAVPVGIAAAIVQVIGLMRWPLLVPGYAADAASSNASVASTARDSFTTASNILGTALGETLGYLLTATWTVLVVVALGRALHRPLVPGARRHLRSARLRRRVLAARAPRDRHRELLRVRALERLADRVRCGDPGTRTPDRIRRVDGLCRDEPGFGVVMNALTTQDRSTGRAPWTRTALRWLPTFFGFPLGGLAAELIVGPVDGLAAAIIGGAITGIVLGAVQAWGLRPNVSPVPWIAATGAGLAVGLGVGAAAVGYGTEHGRPGGAGRDLWSCRRRGAGVRAADEARPARVRLDPGTERAVGARLDDHHGHRRRRGESVHRLRLERRAGRHGGQRRAPARAREPGREERVMSRHVVFGTGQVGSQVVQRLVELGHETVAVNRSGHGGLPGATVVGGDVTDPVFAKDVARDASTVYFCLNAASYHLWPEQFPPLQRAVVGAATASGARLVVLENLYGYGSSGGVAHDRGDAVRAREREGRDPSGDVRAAARRARTRRSRGRDRTRVRSRRPRCYGVIDG